MKATAIEDLFISCFFIEYNQSINFIGRHLLAFSESPLDTIESWCFSFSCEYLTLILKDEEAAKKAMRLIESKVLSDLNYHYMLEIIKEKIVEREGDD